ncbi:MAG: leucine-rich repeat protein [Prevotella sp.]|nr:leucine-rich repeat protein [Prevotella sp.]
MNYPLISEYVEAIKAAEENFEQLKNLRPVLDEDGEPVMSSGNFAVVFKMKDIQTGKLHAVKCFLREQEGRAEAYRMIAEELAHVNSTFLTPIKYLDKELFVDSSNSEDSEFPVLLMDWIEGETLDKYIQKYVNRYLRADCLDEVSESEEKAIELLVNSYELETIAYQFSRLAIWLLQQPFAHGDLKPDNIIVKEDGKLVLVDYDGMFVPGMKGEKARELGSPDFRHPLRNEDDFDEHIDDFPLSSILLSLLAIANKPSLLEEYGGDGRLLLSERDYRNIAESKVLDALRPLMADKNLTTYLSLFYLCSVQKSLFKESYQLFSLPEPEKPYFMEEDEKLSTAVTEEDLADAWIDEFGVMYSHDGRRLLKAPNNIEKYSVNEGTIAICDKAFSVCEKMTSINIPDGVIEIGEYAFSCCNNIQSVTIPNSVTRIGKSAFQDCSSLQTIILPYELTSIEESTFRYCRSLQNIKLPDSLKTINDCAFWGCDSILTFRISDNVTSIGFGVFHECTSLRSLVIPDSVISIDDLGDISPQWIFVSPDSIDRIKLILDSKLQQRLTLYTKEIDMYGATYSEDGKTLLEGPDSFWIKDYPIRKGTLVIGDKAFERSHGLHSITIPDTVTTIGNHSFSGCYALQKIDIPNSVTSIGDYAFARCQHLKSVLLSDSVTHIGEGAFYICNSLTDINIPNSVISIGSHSFGLCESLQSITLPQSVREIHGNPFSGYDGEIKSNSRYFTVYNGNLYDSEMNTLISYCGKDKLFSLPDSVKSIGDCAFCDCKILSVNIPNSVRYIGNRAFYGCYYLQSVTIPNSVECIGDCAFDGCHSLQAATIPNSVTMIGNGLFYYCESLQKIDIPDSVISIGDCAFENCSSLQEITIPDSITSIGKSAFRDCKSLQRCGIPNSISSISERTFSACTSLKHIFLPDSIKYIGDFAFENCEGLQSISYSHSIHYIGKCAFDACSNLQIVEFHIAKTIKDASISDSVSSSNSKSNSAHNTCINNSAFRDCTSLQHIDIPYSITSIGNSAFMGCCLLKTIIIPDSVTSIGEYAFKSCKNLQNVILPNKLKCIPNYVFEDCDSLKAITIPDSVVRIGPFALIFIASVYVSQSSYERIKCILPGFGNNQLIIRNDNED